MDPQAAFKGILIVVATILVGAVIFWQGLHRPDSLGTTNTTLALPPPAASPAGPTSPSPQAPVTRVPPRELSVAVGNAVDVKLPIAAFVADKLRTAGYTNVQRKDVRRTQSRSAVHFATPQWRDDAAGGGARRSASPRWT